MDSSPQPPRSRRKRSPRRADAPVVSVFDLPSAEELYRRVTVEYSTRAQLMEEQRSWLAALSNGAAPLKPPAHPFAGSLFGPRPSHTNRSHHEVLLKVESAAMVAQRLAHLTSYPAPSVVETRVLDSAAAEAVSALHSIVCHPPRSL
ncbi:hypothetical protein LSCM4_00646 [Leishmania orientalis]|uniref:Uncharacterized protein n=1 Tax=Leishmania orientalis TaxID=2249476 RepID=A0A836GW02_9TRYP|nr:hypothetical protein LSCM4_00646 [Leishmania orientalis]